MEISERLSSLRGYVTYLASSFSKDPGFQDDLAQEAMIAMWKELLKAEESGRKVNDSFLLQKARWVMLNELKRQGRQDVPADDPELFDRPSYDRRDWYPEVRAAVAELPERQREYVYLRFWKGWGVKTELAEAGYTRNVWYAPQAGARRVLRDKLAHLADAL